MYNYSTSPWVIHKFELNAHDTMYVYDDDGYIIAGRQNIEESNFYRKNQNNHNNSNNNNTGQTEVVIC